MCEKFLGFTSISSISLVYHLKLAVHGKAKVEKKTKEPIMSYHQHAMGFHGEEFNRPIAFEGKGK